MRFLLHLYLRAKNYKWYSLINLTRQNDNQQHQFNRFLSRRYDLIRTHIDILSPYDAAKVLKYLIEYLISLAIEMIDQKKSSSPISTPFVLFNLFQKKLYKISQTQWSLKLSNVERFCCSKARNLNTYRSFWRVEYIRLDINHPALKSKQSFEINLQMKASWNLVM